MIRIAGVCLRHAYQYRYLSAYMRDFFGHTPVVVYEYVSMFETMIDGIVGYGDVGYGDIEFTVKRIGYTFI